jgi:hypothetical protein
MPCIGIGNEETLGHPPAAIFDVHRERNPSTDLEKPVGMGERLGLVAETQGLSFQEVSARNSEAGPAFPYSLLESPG